MKFTTTFCAALCVFATTDACTVNVAEKTVHSESKPYGQIKAIMITGAKAGATPGGKATSDERCAYFYGPDIRIGSTKPKYSGTNWPYFKVGEGCNVELDSSIPSDAKLREPGFVAVQDGTRILTFGGLPVYQYDDDEPGVCYCNQPPEWTSFNAQGKGSAFAVKYVRRR